MGVNYGFPMVDEPGVYQIMATYEYRGGFEPHQFWQGRVETAPLEIEITQ